MRAPISSRFAFRKSLTDNPSQSAFGPLPFRYALSSHNDSCAGAAAWRDQKIAKIALLRGTSRGVGLRPATTRVEPHPGSDQQKNGDHSGRDVAKRVVQRRLLSVDRLDVVVQ